MRSPGCARGVRRGEAAEGVGLGAGAAAGCRARRGACAAASARPARRWCGSCRSSSAPPPSGSMSLKRISYCGVGVEQQEAAREDPAVGGRVELGARAARWPGSWRAACGRVALLDAEEVRAVLPLALARAAVAQLDARVAVLVAPDDPVRPERPQRRLLEHRLARRRRRPRGTPRAAGKHANDHSPMLF